MAPAPLSFKTGGGGGGGAGGCRIQGPGPAAPPVVCPAMQWDTAGNTVSVDLQRAPTVVNYTLEGGGKGGRKGGPGGGLLASYGARPF